MVLAASSFAADLHYSLVKKESGKEGSTLLVIGGIHGDEPGGYFAPMLLSRYYKIESGNVWVIPNLNFDSIVKNRRGINGDMNRKFAKIDPKDKDLSVVNEIKKLILNPKVDLTLNLHDGQGFYREKNINIISVVMDAPQDAISALSGKLGKLPFVSTKTVYSKSREIAE